MEEKDKKKTIVDISGLDKEELIEALWESSRIAPFFGPYGVGPRLDREEIERVLASEDKDFDYLSGRVMKVHFRSDKVNPEGYDRDNGPGEFKEVVDALRARYISQISHKYGPQVLPRPKQEHRAARAHG